MIDDEHKYLGITKLSNINSFYLFHKLIFEQSRTFFISRLVHNTKGVQTIYYLDISEIIFKLLIKKSYN